MSGNTLFIRLEGPLQAWGVQESKFLVRRTTLAPTKSGVVGLLCAALGVSRHSAKDEWIPRLASLAMGVRIDSPGLRIWDYHTVGAQSRMRIAEASEKFKPGPLVSRREYLCDASFLVALQGEQNLLVHLSNALKNPKFSPYLGRKSCLPSRNLLEMELQEFEDLEQALASTPYYKRFKSDDLPNTIDCLLEWKPRPEEPDVPPDADIWYDVPVSFDPPFHKPRFVLRKTLRLKPDGQVNFESKVLQQETPRPVRARANYSDSQYVKVKNQRLTQDHHLCVFCKSPASTVQHVTYRHAGGQERVEELRALCRLCHDAVTMIEYGLNMGIDRIDPTDPAWRKLIIEKRDQIIRFRSLATRRRRLNREEVE